MSIISNKWNIRGIIIGFSLVLSSLLMSINVHSQEHKDTLQYCKGLKDAGNIKDSYRILKTYINKHPKDFNATWFIAKLAYWNWEIENAKEYYQAALDMQPTNYYLKLDYAMMLVDIGDLNKSIKYLLQYVSYDSLSKDAQLYLAKAYYWKGNTEAALKVLNHLPSTFKNNESAEALKNEIILVKAANCSIQTGYDFDNQPLKHFYTGATYSKFNNSLLNWAIAIQNNQFKTDSTNNNSYIIEASNKFTFFNLGMQINTRIGLSILPFASINTFEGALNIRKKIYKGFSLLLAVDRKPYFFTVSSTQQAVVPTTLIAAIAVDNFKQFSSNIQYQQQLFDGNTIKSFSAWVLSPALKLNKFSIKAGYAYQQADADINNYTTNKSIDSLIAHYATPITGYYIPYFTPKSQEIHSVLLWLNYKSSGRFSITATGSYGLYATLLNPCLYLNINSINKPIIDKGYISQTYTPIDASLKVLYKYNERVSVNASYEYQMTNYYTGQFINATVNILLP